MAFLVNFILFVLGLIIGSFLNVVILRWNTGMHISHGRSVCFSCGRTLSWYELVPLVSYLVQRGRCRGCSARISPQYPLVELSTGLLFLAAYHAVPGALESLFPFLTFLFTTILFCLYIVMFVYDMRHKIIPDFFSYGAAIIALGLIAVRYHGGGVDPLDIVAGASFFLFFYFFWYVSKGAWMGFGDAKLALSIGWALGFYQGVAALLFAFWIGAAYSLALMAFERLFLRKKSLRMRSEIPFGPFILIGFILVFLFHTDIQAILAFLTI